ncbi:Ig-like domain-containing protein [Barnesiella sp. B2-R-119]|uniref:Ig-like domain-containing protein n=1 Tax=Barnesiella sp. B2-R-119 TaxID=2949656 RepID=UPI00202DD09B|nr:Ig-like domain-containing protein [Barnesiella sp. B2-R-119]MCM0688266.1 Ig-like domain-containing protein [Barnesiella sp. B2-R-119]
MKKNYFLHTAILLVALVCGSVPVWSQTYKKISSIEELTDGKYVIAYENMAMENKANGSRIAATAINVTDNAIISPDASIIWEITTTANGMSINNNGTYVVGVNSNNASLSSNFEEKTCEWNFSVEKDNFRATNVQYSNRFLQYNSSSKWFACYQSNSNQKDLTLYKLEETGKSNPELTFSGITGDITKMLADGSYSSKATTKSDATIVYSSSNQEVATIDQQGTVTLLAGGTTVIKAEVAETATFNASFIEYTLKVTDPAALKTFVKVTNDAVTEGKYIIVYQANDDANSVMALNTTNAGKFFGNTEIDLTENKIVTDDKTVMWDITLESDDHYSISNGNIFVGFKGNNNEAYIYNDYTIGECGWNFIYDENNKVFKIQNAGVNTRYLQFNANNNQYRFACYTGSQKHLTLYKQEDSRTAVEVTFNEIDGNQTLFFTKGFTYNSAATATPTRPITYSSSNQEVATISTEGVVTLVGAGTTVIKASTAADNTYQEGAAQYTLTVRNTSVALPYQIDFKTEGLGDWLTYTTEGTVEWESTNYGVQANGFNKGVGEAYLISPAVTASDIILAFSSQKSFNGNDLQLFYSTDFDPSIMSQPSDASWTEITDMATWATSQETTESGNIELHDLAAPIRFAFKYTCEANEAARWTIVELSISKGQPSGIEDVATNEMKVINGKGQVTIETAEAMPIAIYTLTGAQVRQIELVEGTNIIELPTGIYLIGNKKVVVF